ncbi:hypothetical protein FQA47_004892 [Oryzias melastigma]|uniref:HECT domain-containing protein n=1 Tax=Oryzias melastigma TaxID=30732 RepID=A0A834FTJ5_ORYME|nr:hypothetical protein FQA47_004892 [Oryzias melastigma]
MAERRFQRRIEDIRDRMNAQLNRLLNEEPSSEEGEVDITYEELLVFTTGADSIPPLGFQQPVLIEFYDQEPGTRRIPYASTCSLTLFLPRGVGEEEDFKELMNTAIKGSLGFGKV